jgi:hypothetical protein
LDRDSGRHDAPLVKRTRFLGVSPRGEIAFPISTNKARSRRFVNALSAGDRDFNKRPDRLISEGSRPVNLLL